MTNIFNSLGSNYDWSFIWRSLTTPNNPIYSQNLIRFLNEKYQGKTILTYKGREAIYLGLKLLKLPENSQVAITGFTCFAVYQAITQAGLIPVYLDIDPQNLNFIPRTLSQALKSLPQIKVVIIQNTLGIPCDIIGIKKICDQYHLVLIEDLAHSVGTKYQNGLETGSVGDLITLSFSQDKIIDAVSGGALVIRNKAYQHGNMLTCYHDDIHIINKLLDRLYPLFTSIIRISYPYHIGKIFHHFLKLIGWLNSTVNNSPIRVQRLPHWQSHLAIHALKNLESDLHHRRIISKIYTNNLPKKILSQSFINDLNLCTCLRYPLFITDRIKLIKYLKKHQIYISDTWYDAPIAPRKYLPLTNYKMECPHAESVTQLIINLPTHRGITPKIAQQICQIIYSL